ncbi:MAG: LytTR family transcriptional regulator DNA-binding domain-containing protein [Oscillospiraceae bacterium]|nr:LytTR family transcriptional regulator DNA-binding domain-containing protein [Oscillospiraceae bacterium]
MKITIEPLAEGAEEEIIIRSDTLDPELMELIYALKAGRSRLTAYSGSDIVKLAPSEIYYFESVDNRVCVCCEKNVYEVKQKLYELEKTYERSDLLRISKAMIVNVSKIARLAPMMGGRLEAALDNGEKVIISRQYVPDLKKKLGV